MDYTQLSNGMGWDSGFTNAPKPPKDSSFITCANHLASKSLHGENGDGNATPRVTELRIT